MFEKQSHDFYLVPFSRQQKRGPVLQTCRTDVCPFRNLLRGDFRLARTCRLDEERFPIAGMAAAAQYDGDQSAEKKVSHRSHAFSGQVDSLLLPIRNIMQLFTFRLREAFGSFGKEFV